MLPLFLKKHWDKVLLFSLVLFLCFRNYTPGTWLIGWDNIMPEFDIWLNLKRSLFAVWQEYQGLGLVGGMAHATDLIRELVLLPFTLILPHSLIRYLWHFFLIFLGTLGIYTGLKKRFSPPITFLASLFYLLNFGSVQYFWAPLESFSAFWGFFPWLIFSLWDYLDDPDPQNLRRLLLLNLLAIPAFYVQTIFIVYFLCLLLVLFSHFLFSFKKWKQEIGNSAKIALSILFLNSFWLLPFIYFFITNLHQPVAGIGNFMSSEESFARNQFRGTIPDFLLLRGYYYDFPDTAGKFMAPWIAHFSNTYILILGYLTSLPVVFGLYKIIKRLFGKAQYQDLALLLLLCLSSVALLSSTPIFSEINELIRQSSLLNQVFRAPFTKFIVPTIFTFTLLFAYGLETLFEIITVLKYSSIVKNGLSLFFLVSLLIFSLPSFTGNYISQNMRQKVPQDYFQLFNYLKEQPSINRIANLPQGSFWGWTNYNFRVTGSGFIWYGIPQPILDRAFDTWNLKNEQYYWELNYALQSQNVDLLNQVLQKYSISYVLFDNHVYFPDEKIYSKNSLLTKDLLSTNPRLTLEKQFGQIYLYRFDQPSSAYTLSNTATLSLPDFYFIDQAYQDHRDYISQKKVTDDYPFQNLFSNRLQTEVFFSKDIIANIDPLTRKEISPLTFPNQQQSFTSSQEYYHLTDQKSSHLLAINFPEAKLNQGYVLHVNYRHQTGLPLTISATSTNLLHKYLDTRLESKKTSSDGWFVLPPMEKDEFSSGITILFNNTSLNFLSTTNDIYSIDLYPIPFFDLISQTKSDTTISSQRASYLPTKGSIFYYKVNYQPTASGSILVLPQSFSPDWLAFYFNCKGRPPCLPTLLPNHVLINNWANGWQSPASYTGPIYIFFWPQLLEFIGLLLIPLTFFWFTRRTRQAT